MKKFSLLLCAVLISGIVLAQNVTGTVVDENGEPLIGANVLVKGTSTGTITDFDGKYSIEAPEGSTLIFSYTGFRALEETVTGPVVDVQLYTDAIDLEEIIVVGYSPKRRKDVTGAVSSVSSDEIRDAPGVNVQTALRGRAAGVIVQQASGTPGSAVNVRIRGSTSINASNQPLYVIDGVPVIAGDFQQNAVGGQDLNALADLNPNDIASIEVLKDASTAAIYGNRAANGVVLITTKKGSAGATKIDFESYYGTQEAANLVEMMSADQYRDYLNELFGNPDFLWGGSGGNTDWYDHVFNSAPIQQYSLSAQGGDARTRFYTGLTYFDQEGIVAPSRFERYSARLNLDHVASDNITLGINLGYTHSKNNRIRNDNNIFGIISIATLWPATNPVFNEDGTLFVDNVLGWENPEANRRFYQNTVNTNRLIGNFWGALEIIDGLKFKASAGIDALDLREDVYQPSVLQSSNTGDARIAQTRDMRWLTEFTLTYQKLFGQHSLTALVGAGYQEDQIEQDWAQVTDFPTDQFSGLSAGATPAGITGSFTGDRLHSYFGNVNYSFDDRYIATVTFRADGSTRFINDKWGYFPGASVAWRISSEPFLANSNLDELKLRVGWGQTGNNSTGNFAARQLFGGGNNYLDQPGITPTQLGNPDLTWETTTQLNFGVDFVIFNSRLYGSIDYYKKTTDDLLLNRPIPTTSGFLTVPTNVGEVENKGVDIGLSVVPLSYSDFNWEVGVNFGYNENKIIRLFEGTPIDVGFATRLAEGHPIGAFFGWVADGIFQNEQEIEAHADQFGAEPGDIRFRDISGGAGDDGILGTADDLPPDGVINDNDRTFIGQGLPEWTGGLTNVFQYKGIELNAFFQFSIGNDIYNNNLEFAEGMHSVFNTTARAWEGRWQQEGDDEDFPRAVSGDPNNNRRNSTRFVEDGSYLRLKTATLSYNLPSNWLDRVNLRKVRVYVTGENLFTITDYSWFDPEVSTFGGTNTAPGTDFLTFPQARSVIVGINIGI